MPHRVLQAWNVEAVDAAAIPVLPIADFQQIVADALTAGARVSAYFGQAAPGGATRLTAVLADRLTPEALSIVRSLACVSAAPDTWATAPLYV